MSTTLLTRFRPPVGTPLELNYKGPGDLVTDADFAADQAISEVLEARNAPGNVLSEESSIDKGNERLTLLIDPLCGTLSFGTGLPLFMARRLYYYLRLLTPFRPAGPRWARAAEGKKNEEASR